MIRKIDLSALHPARDRMQTFWATRSAREQVLLGVLAVLAAITLMLIAVIAPLRALRQADYQDLHIAALLEAHLKSGDTAIAGSTLRGLPAAILSESAAAEHLTIERIEPEGAGTRVVVGDASFDQVIHWITQVEATSRLRIDQAQIERKGGPGIVRATLVVTG